MYVIVFTVIRLLSLFVIPRYQGLVIVVDQYRCQRLVAIICGYELTLSSIIVCHYPLLPVNIVQYPLHTIVNHQITIAIINAYSPVWATVCKRQLLSILELTIVHQYWPVLCPIHYIGSLSLVNNHHYRKKWHRIVTAMMINNHYQPSLPIIVNHYYALVTPWSPLVNPCVICCRVPHPRTDRHRSCDFARTSIGPSWRRTRREQISGCNAERPRDDGSFNGFYTELWWLIGDKNQQL